ncbi:DUF2630 family protein [Mucilaginibacter pocheonensis]|uniref:Uncharacterized protein YjaG (DUF416 family) n=1 Tax=Mucilaginibacter pocheonensis TaxID=398050 RepID=A0ABU1TER4_9SPHI|nr:DUF2630 family protein [Mucilaginibacter pocheonensis]MDR6943893.1 uncharacterized protein YjaG (DUF416 family) [Mucilaginibacter pocheonensis]
MEDNHVLNHIKNLTTGEEELWRKENLSEQDVKKLHQIKLELDQYWDMLRQRRALRDVNENPDHAEKRDIDTIENYQK